MLNDKWCTYQVVLLFKDKKNKSIGFISSKYYLCHFNTSVCVLTDRNKH